VLDDRGEPLVHGADEHSQARGLHFVGYRVTLGGAFRSAGIQAKQLARAVAPPRPPSKTRLSRSDLSG
jgi:putative flavoprotein involved in K+ transport